MKLSTLIYTSRPTTCVTARSLKAIAENAAQRNARCGVTGLLLYGSGCYFQLLEGGETTVNTIFRRIESDPRHSHIRILHKQRADHRLFPEWHMGKLNLDTPNQSKAEAWQSVSMPFTQHKSIEWVQSNTAVAWVREFIEHHGSAASQTQLT